MSDYNTGEAGLTDEHVAQMQIPQLKGELRRRQLRLAGRKRELVVLPRDVTVAQLLAALRLEREHGAQEDDPDDNNDDDLEEDDDDDEIGVVGDRLDVNGPGNRNLNYQDGGVRVTPAIRRSRQDKPKCTVLTLKGIEDSLQKFSGDDLLSINRWIEDFEEMTDVCGWSDMHMVVFAKKLLTGFAQAFVRQERGMKCWAKLRKALKDEFEHVVSDQQIHRELARRTMRPDESLQQYMHSMREIAGQARVDIQSQIGYIIHGIPDEVINKAMLYGARNMQELKERFKQYEAMKRDMKAETKFGKRKDDMGRRSEVRNQSRQTVSDKRGCFSCGSADHLSAMCPEKEKGAKCFKCNEFGHMAAKCTVRPKKTDFISRPEKKEYEKEVSIDDCKFISVVDTDSDLTLIRSDEYAKLGLPSLGNCKLNFEGLGSTDNETWGEFTKVMSVDGYEFPITLHVVSNKIMARHSLLLGADFLDQAELRVKRAR
ncbi:uncharacterized protein [Bombus flavifrons]|uniref:uncharacterized protein n=1 Tax=Bombus flavifrons TaxID=103934 RepID=UPI0037042B8D